MIPQQSTGTRSSGTSEFSLTVVFREVHEESETYFVAECPEIPGCVSQGTAREEAHVNIQDAMQACLSVLFEDCVRQLMARQPAADISGVCSQERLNIDPTPHLKYA